MNEQAVKYLVKNQHGQAAVCLSSYHRWEKRGSYAHTLPTLVALAAHVIANPETGEFIKRKLPPEHWTWPQDPPLAINIRGRPRSSTYVFPSETWIVVGALHAQSGFWCGESSIDHLVIHPEDLLLVPYIQRIFQQTTKEIK